MRIFFLLYNFVHLLKNIRNNWLTEASGILKFKWDGVTRIAKWSLLKNLYELESNSIIKMSAYENRYNGQIISYSLKDEFIHCYGSQDDLLDKHNISSNKIYQNIIGQIK